MGDEDLIEERKDSFKFCESSMFEEFIGVERRLCLFSGKRNVLEVAPMSISLGMEKFKSIDIDESSLLTELTCGKF